MRNHRATKGLRHNTRKKTTQHKDVWFAFSLIFVMAVVAMIIWISLIRRTTVETSSYSGTAQAAGREAKSPVPPYYASADAAKPYPKLIPATAFREYPLAERAYKIAAEIPGVLAQQPCYCYCDRIGHHSLLDCYASDHAARCFICIKEALLADQMTQQSKTPAEIRRAIISGKWQTVDVQTTSR